MEEKEIYIDNPNAHDIIGTLGEKTLHSFLKNLIEPDTSKHEKRFLGYVADIVNENGITEIQTGNFNRLREKLSAFLDEAKVTVVYPAPRQKWLIWIDPNTGEVTDRRKSPKLGQPYAIYPELYKIKPLLLNPNLSIKIIPVDIEEYRKARRGIDDPKKSGRYGSVRCERIPLEIGTPIDITSSADYIKIIPQKLDGEFTSKDFSREAKLSLSKACNALNVLHHIGAVERSSKKGNSYIYRIVN